MPTFARGPVECDRMPLVARDRLGIRGPWQYRAGFRGLASLGGSSSSATDIKLAVALGHRRPPEWQYPREHAVPEVQAGHPGEDPLRSTDHLAGRDVVGRVVPGAHQAAVLLDAATCHVSAQVAAPAGDREG